MDIGALRKEALDALLAANSPEDREAFRVRYLGRKDGEVTKLLRGLKDLPEAERRIAGPAIQALARELEDVLSGKSAAAASALRESATDLTMPGKSMERGHLHPLTLVENDIRRIFTAMNFSVVDGPEAETERHNFDALNIPGGHPARDMWDTFWIKESGEAGKSRRERMLLRTHTSPVQIRYMESHRPPLRIIVPGRVFRYEALDASHMTNFYQVEGLMIGERISFATFKFILEEFFERFFEGQKIDFRYRPSYFPFVEPGVEVDIRLGGKWLEVMGAGMVHRRVLEGVGIDPGEYQGFAFGTGVERLAMIKYGITDIRLFYSGDLRFIKQF